MRYSHPNKAPNAPMYYWISKTYERIRIEQENLVERSAIHWYETFQEREKYFRATPMKVFWECMKEQFPDAYIDIELLPKTVIEVDEENKILRAENERLREGLVKISLADTDAYRENHYHELKRVVDIAEQALKEVKE